VTLQEYIKKNKYNTFNDEPFNEVDNLLLSTLIYIDFRSVLCLTQKKEISLFELGRLFFQKYDNQAIKKLTNAISIQKIISNFKLMASTVRYGDILLKNYVNEIEENTQFGAVTFILGNGTNYIAFEGTDDSVSGWKEDFIMSYQFPVLAQKKAANYLNNHVSLLGPKIIIGGHSKGGNLAKASYMMCHFWIRSKIICIYNNDGPGFRKKEYNSSKYRSMLKKLKMFVPEEGLVGLLFYHPDNYTVVKSNYLSIFQHDSTSWLVAERSFQVGKISNRSKKLEKRIFNWINSYDDKQKEKIVTSMFSILEKGGILGLSELRLSNINKIIGLLRENKEMEPETKKLLISAFKSLLLQELVADDSKTND